MSRILTAGAALLLVALTGCTATVTLDPARHANDPACAEVVVRLPDTVAGLPARETDAQATGAWGEPARVLLWCGVEPPGPTAEFACLEVDGIHWLRDATDEPVVTFITYGRDPAVSVRVDGEHVSGGPTLQALAPAVAAIPAERDCVALEDVFGG